MIVRTQLSYLPDGQDWDYARSYYGSYTGYSDVIGDTYVTVDEADTYAISRNNSVWAAASTVEKEAALRQATMYLDFGYAWRAFGSVPYVVKQAQMELAFEGITEPLIPTVSSSGNVEEETVGPLTVRYFRGQATTTVVRRFPLVDLMLAALTMGRRGGITIQACRA